MRIVRPLALLVAIGIALTGCSEQQAEDSYTTPKVPTSLPKVAESLQLPFDAYDLPRETRVELDKILAKHIEECTAGYGVTTEFAGDFWDPEAPEAMSWGGRIGTMSLDHAAQFGYAASSTTDWARMGGLYMPILHYSPSMDYKHGQDSEEMSATKALVSGGPSAVDEAIYPQKQQLVEKYNVPDGGCRKQVLQEFPPLTDDVISLDMKLVNLTLIHPDFVKAQTVWSSCMKTAGYDYQQVQAPIESHPFGTIDAETVALATQDVKCTEQSRWDDYYYYILADYQNQEITKNPAQFENAHNALLEFVKAVRAS